MHFGTPFSKDKKLSIEEIMRRYKEVARIMGKRGLLPKRRDDNTFYAYINDDIISKHYKHKSQKFFSKSL